MHSLRARLTALERQRPSTEPFCVLVMVIPDGTTALVCYPLPAAHTERMTLGEYRTRYGETYRHREAWTICGDTEPVEDRMSEHW